jgi:hypothetical protein
MKTLRHIAVRTAQGAVLGAASMGLLMAPTSGLANGSEVKLSVTATILKRASLKVLDQPSAVVITAADIAKGYVDIPGSAQLAVKSNSAVGYMLVFTSQGDFVRQTRVRGLGNDVQLGAAGGVVPLAPAAWGVTNTTMALGFRFELSDSARQGTYAWPVQMSIVPM